MNEYYIVCKRHFHKKDYAILFWGPNHTGYRYNVNDAGIYTNSEIITFNKNHHDDDMPVLKSLIDELLIDMVIDNSKLGKICLNNHSNRKLLGIKLSELLSSETVWDKRAFCDPKTFVKINQNTLTIITQIKKTNLLDSDLTVNLQKLLSIAKNADINFKDWDTIQFFEKLLGEK